MPTPKITRTGNNLTLERTISGTTNGGLMIKLIRNFKGLPENLGIAKSSRVILTQTTDGKKGSWEVIDD